MAGSRATPVELARRWLPTDVPLSLQVYNSYAADPPWQTTFTVVWTSILGLTFLLSTPYITRSIRNGRLYSGLLIKESNGTPPPSQIPSSPSQIPTTAGFRSTSPGGRLVRSWRAGQAVVQSLMLWTLPMPNIRFWKSQVGDCCRRAYFSLRVSQMGAVVVYLAIVLVCLTVGADLKQNSNRAGFIALATLPLVILLSLKSPLPLPIFLPSLSYEHYNFLHRWAGRTLFLLATVHGGMWLNQFIYYGEYDQVWADKTKRGMISYGLLCGIVITSLKPVRRLCYQLFWVAHISLFTGFFAAISYHTPYSLPWVYPCAAIYAYDLTVRAIRYRIKDATLVPVDDTLTMIHIPDCDAGWLPTQHVLLRVFKGSGIFESHPFTITNSASPFSATPRGITLYAKVSGDWTRKLNLMAREISILEVGESVEEREAFLQAEKEGKRDVGGLNHPGKKVHVMIDGPYGGLKLDLGEYESVLLVAGGSGITFVLGAIEEALRCKAAGRGPGKVEVAWVVRDLSTMEALSSTLLHLHVLATRLGLELQYNIYLSNPPTPLPISPATLPASTTLSPYRPEVAQLVREALPPPPTAHLEGASSAMSAGGLAVVACGPEGIVSEAANAVASMGIHERARCGGIGFHGECYAL